MVALPSIQQICDRDLAERELRTAVLEEFRRTVPFSNYAWLLTDPRTCVGLAPLAEVPVLADLPRLIALKYVTAVNRWTTLSGNEAVTLHAATGGQLADSALWRELLAGYGVRDVASVALRDRFGCWGFLDLWRTDATFTAAECVLLSELARIVAPALRSSLARLFEPGTARTGPPAEPVVMLLSGDLQPMAQTPPVDAQLRALLPTPIAGPPVPAAAYNVAGQLLARERGIDGNPATARTHVGEGRWVTVAAARLAGDPPVITVDFAPTTPEDRSELFARVAGFSRRECEVLALLVAGADTREVVRAMSVSEHTVQDHLKAMFAKADVRGRRLLVARATGMR